MCVWGGGVGINFCHLFGGGGGSEKISGEIGRGGVGKKFDESKKMYPIPPHPHLIINDSSLVF